MWSLLCQMMGASLLGFVSLSDVRCLFPMQGKWGCWFVGAGWVFVGLGTCRPEFLWVWALISLGTCQPGYLSAWDLSAMSFVNTCYGPCSLVAV